MPVGTFAVRDTIWHVPMIDGISNAGEGSDAVKREFAIDGHVAIPP